MEISLSPTLHLWPVQICGNPQIRGTEIDLLIDQILNVPSHYPTLMCIAALSPIPPILNITTSAFFFCLWSPPGATLTNVLLFGLSVCMNTCLGPYLEVLKAVSELCTQGSLLVEHEWEPKWYWRLNSSWLHARPASYLLYYSSGPIIQVLL